MTTRGLWSESEKDRFVYGAIVFWLLVSLSGLAVLWIYSLGPGEPARPPKFWPSRSALHHAPGVPTLVLVAHPRCACTRASLENLARMLASTGRPLLVHVLFVRPHTEGDSWVMTDLWETARAIPGVEVHVDDGGKEARRFGAQTSGTVLLYDASGLLVFNGGLTPARGHAGDSAGSVAILSAMNGRTVAEGRTPVFGCQLAELGAHPEERSR